MEWPGNLLRATPDSPPAGLADVLPRSPTPEERDRETARRIQKSWLDREGLFPQGVRHRMKEAEIEEALSTARREGEAEAAVLREALEHIAESDNNCAATLARDYDKCVKLARNALSSTTAGASLLKRLDDLREAVAAAYQIAGSLDAPVEVLDNLSDIANGDPLRHTWEVAQNAAANLNQRKRLEAAVRQRDEYLKLIQCDLNVQIDAAETALIEAGLEDWETLATGIKQVAQDAENRVKILEAGLMERSQDFRTKGHPEANGRQPVAGDHAYTFTFPLENGGELRVHGGHEDLERFSDMIGRMMIDDNADSPPA